MCHYLAIRTAKLSQKVVKRDDGSYQQIGLDVIETQIDPEEARRKNLFLSVKGKKVIRNLLVALR